MSEIGLFHQLSHHQYLRERLETDFPEADEETLADTLEGLSDLPEMLGAVIRSHLDDQAFALALRGRIEDMQSRLKRLEYRAERKRELVRSVMEQADLKKLVESDFTVSLRSSRPPLVVTNEESIPGDFWKVLPPKLDRQGLIKVLQAGTEVPGAVLRNSAMTISVRTK